MKIRKNILLLLFFFIITCCNRKKIDYKKVFRYNEASNITSLDPAFSSYLPNIWAVNQIFSGLIDLDSNLKVVPNIAKRWKISKDGLEYIFFLRDDVYFHKHFLFKTKDSTRNVIADDFVYSFSRLKDKDVSSPGKWTLNNVSNFKAIDDTTFSIKLKNKFSPFLNLLTMKYFSVVPREVVEYYKEQFRSNPIGTGAFKFKVWYENKKLVLRKNNFYYKPNTPYLEAISISFIVDRQVEFLEFVKGNLDMVTGIDNSYKDEILDNDGDIKDKYKDNFYIHKKPYLRSEYLGFFLGDNRLDTIDIRIRKAINYGINRKDMIKYLRNNIGIPANRGIVPPSLSSFHNGYKYDLKKARKYILDYQNDVGSPAEITINTTNAYLNLGEYIQNNLKKIGLNIKINIHPTATLRELKSKYKVSFFRANWISDYPDAENFLSLFYSKNLCPNGPNYCHFEDDEYDSYYSKSISDTDEDNKKILYRKMDSIIIEKAVIVPLFYDEAIKFISKKVKGLYTNSLDLLDLKKVYKTD